MPRFRSIAPEVTTDPKLLACSPLAGLLATWSWPWHDDHGCLGYEPARLRHLVFPSRDIDVAALIGELIAAGWFELYEGSDGKLFLWCTEFLTYQRVDKPSKQRRFSPIDQSRRLASPREHSGTVASSREPSRVVASRREGSPVGNGSNGDVSKERNGTDGGSDARECSRDAPAPPLASLDASVAAKAPAADAAVRGEFLETFYFDAVPARRADVERQVDAMFADNAIATRDALRGTIADKAKIRNRDRAIVVAIKKREGGSSHLHLDATGRTPTEGAAARHRDPAYDPPLGKPDEFELARALLALDPHRCTQLEIEASAQSFPDAHTEAQRQRRRQEWLDARTLQLYREAGAPSAEAIASAGSGALRGD